MAYSSKSILVAGVPANADVDTVTNKLTIHFQKKEFGGEVEQVILLANDRRNGDQVCLVAFHSPQGVNAALRTHDDKVHRVRFGTGQQKVQLTVTACPLDLESKYLGKGSGDTSTSNAQADSIHGKKPSTEASSSTSIPSDASKQTTGSPFNSVPQTHYGEGDKMPPLAGMVPDVVINKQPGINLHNPGQSGLPPNYASQPGQTGLPPQYPSPPRQSGPPPNYASQSRQSGPPPQQSSPAGQSGQPPNYAVHPGQPGVPFSFDNPMEQYGPHSQQPYFHPHQQHPMLFMQQLFHSLPPAKQQEMMMMMMSQNMSASMSTNHPTSEIRTETHPEKEQSPADPISSDDEEMVDVSDADTNYTIEVSSCNPNTSEETIEMYFDNKRRSGGGDVSKCRQEGDKFFVTFENQDAMMRVLEQSRHVVEDSTLTVRKAITDNKSTLKAAGDEDVSPEEDPYIDCRLEVTGFNPETSVETLEMYFENRRSGGGSIRNIEMQGSDKVIITFENSEVMKRVLERTHVIDKTPLTVKEPPKKRKPRMKQLPMDKKCLLLKGLADNTSKENILLFLENRTRIEEDPELLFGVEPGTVLARYQEDIPDFDTIVQRIRMRKLNGASLVAQPMTLTNSILVLNLPTNITNDTIELYFENKRKSGGGDVEEVNIDYEKHVAVIYFEDYQVVNSVISRRHVINKVQLDVQPYHECLGFTVSSDGPTPRIPQPFTYTVNSDIIGFIMNNNQEEFEHLHQQLYVQVEWPHLDKSDVVLLKPNLSQDTKNLHQITKTWVNDVKSGLDKYLHSFKAVQIPVMEGIWLQVVGQLKGWSQNKDVHIIMDQSTSIINLTGKSDYVHKLESRIKSVIKDIEDEMQKAKERTSETVKINSIQARQLLMCKFSKVVQNKYPDVDVKINPKTETLSLKGLPHDILNTRVMMYEILKDIPIIKMKPPTMSLLQYLKISEVSKRLHAEFSSAKIQAFIVLQDDEIVCSATDKVGINKAVEIIQTSIKELRIDIKPQSMAALQKQEWRTMASGLEERQTVRISHEPNSVLIIGFETEANMVKAELQEFIQVHTIVDNLFETENGKLRFVFEYRKDDISKIQSESRITPLNIKPCYKGAATGFLIKGTEDDVKTATVKIQKLTDDIHGRPYPVDKPGMPKLFKEEKGKNYIKLVENEIKCKIDINDPSEEIETRADEEDMEEDFEELMQDPSPTFDILCHHTIHGGRRIVVGKGDLTKMHVDVVVNAANPSLDHSGGGLTKAIVVAGGPKINQEIAGILRKQSGRLHAGQVVHTSGGNMPCKIVIHAIGPTWNKSFNQSSYGYYTQKKSQEENMLADAVSNSLSMADYLKFSSIAIPAISSGGMGFPLDLCTQTIVNAVHEWAKKSPPGLLSEIRLMDNSDKTCESFKNAILKEFGEDKVSLTSDDTSTTLYTDHHRGRQTLRGMGNQPGQGGGIIGNYPDDEPLPGGHGIHGSSKPGEIKTKEGKTICLVKGSIAQQKVDVIVNTTQSTLNLNTGAVSKSILLAGGMRLQQEINSQKMSGITTNEGDVIVTSGGNMQCTNIYHVLCCSWDPRGTNASQVLRKIMQTCLNTASQNGYSSIAFPAIGTGGLQFPRDATARIMYEEVTSYSSNNPASSISNILFVVYDQDFPTIQAFEDEIGRLTGVPLKKRHGHGSGGSAAASRIGANSSAYGGFTPVKPKKKKGKVSPGQTFQGASGYAASASRGEAEDTLYMQFKEKPGGSGDCQMMVGNVLVQLQKGDITNEMTDAIVNSSNVNLDLRQGAVSQAILKKGGGSIVAECQRLGRQQEDSVVMTNAGNMKCTKIIHMITPYRKLEDSIIEMLLFAEKQRLSSIAMPAVGTGALAIPPKTVAHIILDAIGDFVQQNNPKFLKVIRITIFQPPLVAVFNKEMKSMIGTPMKDTRSVIGKAWGSFKSWVGASDNPPKKDFARMADTIILYIYAESKNDIDAAITKIENLMATEFIDTTIVKDTVKKLTDEDMSEIYQVAEPLKVKVEQIDTGRVKQLRIQGITQSVMQVLSIANSILDRISAEEGRKREAMLLAKNVKWMFLNETGDFEAYDDEICGIIEQARNSGNPQVDFKIEGGTYRIDFKRMIEMDVDNLTSTVEVRRELKEGGVQLPSHWTIMPSHERVRVENVPSNSSEYQSVETRFKATLRGSHNNVIKIERIQNPRLYRQYVILKQTMDAKNKQGTNNERILYHGTSSDSVGKINTGGFNRSFAGKNATYYGAGSYFAVESSYSASKTYSPVDPNTGHKHVYHCKVLTGEFTTGSQGLLVPPSKNPNDPTDCYDSVTDNVQSPTLFVVFNDAMAYPEYHITFT